jgi:CRISPR/Cas system type I-B associated protein Csh2 (Cas7 group RAMP superfamily)
MLIMDYKEKVDKLYKYLFERYRNVYLGFYIPPIKNETVMSFSRLYYGNHSGYIYHLNKNNLKHGIEIELKLDEYDNIKLWIK